ncbi:MAG TPA: NADH-quinone oxidoreductase subunit L [Steroidobacteraceae bacterium]|nr:NADH-quinone oxidoreductase subunit L [Steroidobacteraceae bacterium]
MNPTLLLAIPMLPLLAAVLAGLAGRRIGRAGAAAVTIAAVGIACLLSLLVLKQLLIDHVPTYQGTVYTWLVSDGVRMQVGFLVDRLTALMMVVVTFVSLCVHVYTIGYMSDDPGYQRFFAYISLFTFSMLMLVMSNNFMQLFFGWEAVGLVSYLLIGFWYTRPSAIFANLKAFLVNRIGDFGFLLGIAGVLYYTGSLDYSSAFAAAPFIAAKTLTLIPGHPWSAMSLICICLFIGAMGKSAQMPLHVWLPDSMEGPTPISALIHAATMVTAGIFMVARMSPLFEYSDAALSFVLVIGATTALFMGFLGIVNNDIKRVIAYSTLSQLGYMTAALGVSAYSVAIFHLMTHAFFKALLFLAAGAVIIAMHHEQDMRQMGGLRRRMPVTYWTALIGALALIGTPFFSGFYSKDTLIDAVGASHRLGADYAYWCVLLGVFVTALYTFRMIFLTFHGPERLDHHAQEHFHDVGWNMKGPLVALAIPSLLVGYFTIEPLVFGGYFGDAIRVLESHDAVGEMRQEWHGPIAFALSSFMGWAPWLAALGVFAAWYFVLHRPQAGAALRERFAGLKRLLDNKYYFDWFNENVLARLTRGVGIVLWRGGDQAVIDGAMVNGTAGLVGWLAVVTRQLQSGFLYSYAFWMIIGLAVLLGWFLFRL